MWGYKSLMLTHGASDWFIVCSHRMELLCSPVMSCYWKHQPWRQGEESFSIEDRGRKEDSFPPLLHHRTSSLHWMTCANFTLVGKLWGGCLNPHNLLPGNFSRCYFCSSCYSYFCVSSCSSLGAGQEPICAFTPGGAVLASSSWFTLLWGFLALGNPWVSSVQFLCIY